MNAKELAEASGLHFNTIYNMIKSGELKCKKVGKRYVIDNIQAERLIRAKEIGTNKSNAKYSSEYVLNILYEQLHENDVNLLNAISKIANDYEVVLLKIKELDLSLDDKRVISIIGKLFKTESFLSMNDYISQRERVKKVINGVESIERTYSDYEEKESSKKIKERYEKMSDNKGKKVVYEHTYIQGWHLGSEFLEDILKELEDISK